MNMKLFLTTTITVTAVVFVMILTSDVTVTASTSGWCYNFKDHLFIEASSANPEVGALHTVLEKEGIDCGVDAGTNNFTNDTVNAVADFQQKYNLPQTGEVDNPTRIQLNKLYGCSDAITTSCAPDWQCGPWGMCKNLGGGHFEQDRQCKEVNGCEATTGSSPTLSPGQTNSWTGTPVTMQQCQFSGCIPDWKCSDWSGCANGSQTRTCQDYNKCYPCMDSSDHMNICFETEGQMNVLSTTLPQLSRSCTSTCKPSWKCFGFATAPCFNGVQTQFCYDVNYCGTTDGMPALTKSCTCTSNWIKGIKSTCTNGQRTVSFADLNKCLVTEQQPNANIHKNATESCNDMIQVQTDPETTFTKNTFYLNGTLSDMGTSESVYVWFQVGNTTSYELTETKKELFYIPQTFIAIFTPPVKRNGMVFHYRAVAQDYVTGKIIYGNDMTFVPYGGTCTPFWQCQPWHTCTNGQMTRECADNNFCNTTSDKPILTTPCVGGNVGVNAPEVWGIGGAYLMPQPSADPRINISSEPLTPGYTPICTPTFQCTDWSSCNNGQQNRYCNDVNHCHDAHDVFSWPQTNRECTSSAQTSCTPSCANAACGGSDGCGGICQIGSCQAGQSCINSKCVANCVPSCNANSMCGQLDGCGGTCDGFCSSGKVCMGSTYCTYVKLQTTSATNVQSTSAVLNGTLVNYYNGSVTLFGLPTFEYGTKISYGKSITAPISITSLDAGETKSFSVKLTGLQPSTTYHYRTSNSWGDDTVGARTYLGNDVTFTTLSQDVIIACSSNTDCGTDKFTDDSPVCQNGNVYVNYISYTCNNPGVSGASCVNNTALKLKTTCASGQTCTAGACVAVVPTCATFTYSSWSPAVCDALKKQTRTITGSSPSGCTGGSPQSLEQTCVCTPNCTSSTCGGSDGCGGKCQTGTCASGQTCAAGICISSSPATTLNTQSAPAVTSVNDQSSSDSSGDTTDSLISITAPTADSAWTTGKSNYIKWTVDKSISKVNITLTNTDTGDETTLRSNVSASRGYYIWNISKNLAPGTYTVTVTDASDDTNTATSDPFTLTVKVSSIKISSPSTKVSLSSTLQLSATVSPDNASDSTVTWSVKNGTGKATIDDTGLLTPTKVGTVTVTATANDGSKVKSSKTITITKATTTATANK